MTRRSLLYALSLTSVFACTARPGYAQRQPGYNYEEASIAAFQMLDPLTTVAGGHVSKPAQWPGRRAEILRLFEENVFGRTPDAATHAVAHARIIEHNEHALGGLAVREQIELTFDPAAGITPPETAARSLRLLLYAPASSAAAHRRAPVVLGPNFSGNQTVIDDPGIQPTPTWSKPRGTTELLHAVPADSTRGAATQQWQVRRLLERGYALATFYYGDLEPDFKDAAQYSARTLYTPGLAEGKPQPPDTWGAIGVWAWGLSRCLDYLQLDPLVDATHVAVTGHSRLGKTADWAAAQDTRFAAVLSTESGHGGQSIQRRALGETVAHLEHSFPYWFAPAYDRWVDHDRDIPADGNLLLSLIAPRPLYVASAVGDEWSDPKGEFLSAVSASRVYRLLGQPALEPKIAAPPPDQPIGVTNSAVAYHDRTGKHDVTAFDWQQYIDFLDARWGKPVTAPAVPPTGLPAPPAAAHAASKRQVEEWRSALRQTLYVPAPLPAPDTQMYSTTEIVPGVTLERLSYVTAYGLRVPANIFRPTHAAARRLPAIVVVNGHGADKSSWYSWYTGLLYAKAGAVVLTYDPIGEGERNDDHKDFTGEHDALVPSPTSMPRRLGGLMITDAIQAVSTLAARPDVDPHRIAMLGFSMGSFVASLTGAADPRIHALLVVGGGDLDGIDGYWDLGHAIMCQAAPYMALRQALGPDRPAVLFTLNARRGDTFIVNGTNDTVVGIPTHGPDFFAALRTRVVALNGSEKGVFTTSFDEGASHRPSWMTPLAAGWLNRELAFPAWAGKDVAAMPTVVIGEWARRVGATFMKNYERADRDAGIRAVDADAPLLTTRETDVLPREQWQQRKKEFVYGSWLERASTAAAQP